MNKQFLLFLFFVLSSGLILATSRSACAQSPSELAQAILEETLDKDLSEKPQIEGEPIRTLRALRAFYSSRDYKPLWFTDAGEARESLNSLAKAVERMDAEGLPPQIYHLDTLQKLTKNFDRGKGNAPASIADLDLLASDAYLLIASHLSYGLINAERVKIAWFRDGHLQELVSLLEQAALKDQVLESIETFIPESSAYRSLRDAYASFRTREREEVWPKIPLGPKLELGETNKRVSLLRERLHAEGYLSDKKSDVFDELVRDALLRYQKKTGLEADGVAGRTTLDALNTPLEFRLCQIRATLDRLRGPSRNIEPRAIVVNVPAFELKVLNHGVPDFEMKVITGRPSRATPIFNDKMAFIIFNPYWTVPKSIAIKDKLPLIRKNPDYLANSGMKLYQISGEERVEVDPRTIDWESVSAQNFDYRIVQDPSAGNALGRIKFMFPNAHEVYLHDTPEKHLFTQSIRAFSSGCIRLDRPEEFAEYILGDPDKWSKETVAEKIESGESQRVDLPEPIPVHLTYHTAWVDHGGDIVFRSDIYKLDQLFCEATKGN